MLTRKYRKVHNVSVPIKKELEKGKLINGKLISKSF